MPLRRRAIWSSVRSLSLLVLVASAACSPVFDWRRSEPEGSGLQVLFPCRPDRSSRPAGLADGTAPVPLTLLSCEAADQTFAVVYADLPAHADAGKALDALRQASLRNLGATDAVPSSAVVPGADPVAGSGTVVARGRLPDGRPVVEHLLLFARGSRAYQAAVVGAAPDREAVETFFGALRVAR